MPMGLKAKLEKMLRGDTIEVPPRFESEFAPETLERWRAEGHLGQRTPEAAFGLLRTFEIELPWRRLPEESVPLTHAAALEALRRAYDPEHPGRFPEGWQAAAEAARARGEVPYVAPWNEGFFQILGVSNGASLDASLTALREAPELAEAAMSHYAAFIESMLDRVLPALAPDFVLLYEPIASNHGAVIGPDEYRHFAGPALRRVNDCLERHGVRFRVLWSTGAVQDFFPVWLDAGVTAFNIEEGPQSGITYAGLRKAYGKGLCLLGGIDWRAVAQGSAAIEAVLNNEVRPLLEEGRYIPHLNDSVRAYLPYADFACYRQRLDALLGEIFPQ